MIRDNLWPLTFKQYIILRSSLIPGEEITLTPTVNFSFYEAFTSTDATKPVNPAFGGAVLDVFWHSYEMSQQSAVWSLLTGLIPEAVAAAVAADGGASTCPPASTRDSTLTNACRDSEQIGEMTHEPARSRRRRGARWDYSTSPRLIIAGHIPSVMPQVTYSRTRRVDIMQMASAYVNKPTDNWQIRPRADIAPKLSALVHKGSCPHMNLCSPPLIWIRKHTHEKTSRLHTKYKRALVKHGNIVLFF